MPHFLNDIPASDALPELQDDVYLATVADWQVTDGAGRIVYPNVPAWRPGDVLLVSGNGKGLGSEAIRTYQRAAGLSGMDAATVHVAVFDGEHIWDIVPRQNVQKRSVAGFFNSDRCYGLLRYTQANVDRAKLVRFLISAATQRYFDNPQWIGRLLSHRVSGRSVPADELAKVWICSTFVRRALQVSAGYDPDGVLLPGDFAAVDGAVRVTIEWFAAR